MKEKLILKDGSAIEIESGSSIGSISVVSESKSAMVSVWDKLTDENLKEVQAMNSDGTVIGQYANLILDSETSIIQSDGTVLTSFHLREKTEVELLREEVEELKAGQEVQDGAISDLGAAVSDIAGGEA